MIDHSLALIALILIPRHDQLLTDLTLHGRVLNTFPVGNRIIVQIAGPITVFTGHYVLEEEWVDRGVGDSVLLVFYEDELADAVGLEGF